MSRMRSKSFINGQQSDPLLKQHIEKLAEQSQQYIRLKLKYEQQKQARINAVQKNFIEWASRKENQIHEKLQKSAKNKEEHINQIVKKCKQHDKYLAQRLKNYKDKKKTNLREAWVESQKYHSKNDGQHFDNDSKGKTLKYPNQLQVSNKGRARSKLKSENKEDLGLLSKDNDFGNNRQFRIREKHYYLTLPEENVETKQTVDQKLEKKWARFQQNNLELQRLKIQELGERLQKIQQGRLKKIDFIKRQKQKHKTTDFHKPKQNVKHNLSSERKICQSTVRESRIRDRSQTYKDRREQSFQAQLQNGNEYVSNSKIKYLKTKIARKMEMSAIQKMLYLQRLKH